MTNEEAKQAFFDRVPVIYDGIKYNYISAIIYRRNNFKERGKVIVSAELVDKCGHCLVIARACDLQEVSE